MGYFLADKPPGGLVLTPQQFMELRNRISFCGGPEELAKANMLEVPGAIEALSEILGHLAVTKAMRGYKPVHIRVDWQGITGPSASA